MRTTSRSEAEATAEKEAARNPLAAGQHRATIIAAMEGVSNRNNEKIDLMLAVIDAQGREYRLRDWLTDTPAGRLKLRHAAAAVGAVRDFEAGNISAQQFVGRAVLITTEIERKRGYAPRALITDYATVPDAVVTPLRQAG